MAKMHFDTAMALHMDAEAGVTDSCAKIQEAQFRQQVSRAGPAGLS